MCSGHITRYSCGHEKRTYYYQCPDGRNEYLQELLPHRMIGPKYRSRRLCGGCERNRRCVERDEEDNREEHEVRAKALLEFFRGERPWSRPDDEVSALFRRGQLAGERLHPWLNHGHEQDLIYYRGLLAQNFPETGLALFQEMLDRQAEIDQTGVFLATDLAFRLDTLVAQAAAFAASSRRGRQAEIEAFNSRNRFVLEMLRNQEQNRNSRDIPSQAELATMMQGAERVQDLPWVRQQIMRRALNLINETREELGWNEPGESEGRQQLDRIEGMVRDVLLEGYEIFGELEQFFIRRGQAIRNTGEIGLANRLEGEMLELHRRQFIATWSEMEQFREEIIRALRDGNHSAAEAGQQDPVMQREPPQMDQLNSLYASDPDWPLNFDDWCNQNSDFESENPEVDLRRDVNGWFHHLRTCQPQAWLEWIPFAETCRDAILQCDRCHFEYVPLLGAGASEPVLSFRNWCLQNARPAEIQYTPLNSIFIDLIQGYSLYLENIDRIADLFRFQGDRLGRVQIMRGYLAAIPGAPASRELDGAPLVADAPSNWLMETDIRRLTREGGFTTETDIQQRHDQINRFNNLRTEANGVHESRLPGFRIERNEGEARARDEQERARQEGEEVGEGTSDEDNAFFMIPRTRRIHNMIGRAAREREERVGVEQELQDEDHGRRVFSFTIPIPATIQSGIDELQSSAYLSQDSEENTDEQAARNHHDWLIAADLRRAEQRAIRETQDEADRECEAED